MLCTSSSTSSLQQLSSQSPSTSSVSCTPSIRPISKLPIDIQWDIPIQPSLKSYPKDYDSRSFNEEWYRRFSWLEYSVERDAVFCFPCRYFTPKVPKEDAFTSTGYRNWKRALGDQKKGLQQHNNSIHHLHSMTLWIEYQRRVAENKSISTLLCDTILDKHRYYVQSIADVIKFLVVNELPLRADDSEIGLFRNLFEYSLYKDEKLADVNEMIPKNATCMSGMIQNDVIEVMSAMVSESVAQDVNSADVPW